MVTEGEPDNGTARHNARVIAGRYRLEARIGRGGMGVVWRATDQLLGRSVAVKELPFDETLSATEARRQRDRTLREARALAQLSHPNIIVVHDVVEDDERPYIVLELIEGPSLAERIAEQGPVDAAEAARIGVDLLGALRAAHTSGVLHRDLKPANVLLEDDTDRVLLTDFGIAQVSGSTTLTEAGSFVGSPEYTAPERMSGARTGPESDLWSLGALLCTALSGESPFRRDSLSGVLHAVVVDEIRPPAEAGPILPVVRGLLERDPDRRLDADRAERMLRAFLATGRTPQSAPPELLPPDREPARRRFAAWRAATAGATPDAVGPGGSRSGSSRSGVSRPGTSRSGTSGPGGTFGEPPVRRQPTRGVILAALAVAAMAGAGMSAAALLLQDRDGDGGGTPSSTAPETPPGDPAPGPRPPASVPTTTSPQRTLPSGAGPQADPTTAGPTTAGPTTAGPTTAGPTTADPETATPTTVGPSVSGSSPQAVRKGR